MIRRLKYLTAIFFLTLCLGACGHDSETDVDTSAETEQTGEERI